MELNQMNRLVLSAKLYRLTKDIELINKGIEDNKEVSKDEKDNIFKKFGKSVSNSVKKSRTENYEKALAKDQEEVAKTKIEGVLENEQFSEEAKKVLDSQAKKAAFGLTYLLYDNHEYDSKEETLSSLSEALYGSKEALSTLSRETETDFRLISESLFSGVKSNDLVNEAMNGYFLSLSKKGEEKCALCQSKALLGEENKAAPLLALLLAGKGGLPYCNDEEKAKKAFLAIDKDSYYAIMAVKSILLQEEKKEWSEEEKKANLKGVLTAMSELTLLSQIALIIDKTDPDGAKIKLKGTNGFVKRLTELSK